LVKDEIVAPDLVKPLSPSPLGAVGRFAQGIDPYTYLWDVLTKLPALTNRQMKEWTPAAYAKRLREERYLQAAAS
jgi:hypothetical protein